MNEPRVGDLMKRRDDASSGLKFGWSMGMVLLYDGSFSAADLEPGNLSVAELSLRTVTIPADAVGVLAALPGVEHPNLAADEGLFLVGGRLVLDNVSSWQRVHDE